MSPQTVLRTRRDDVAPLAAPARPQLARSLAAASQGKRHLGRWQWIGLGLLVVLLSLPLIYQVSRPHIAQELAYRLPITWVRSESAATLALLDQRWLRPSSLSVERQDGLRASFSALTAPLYGSPPYQLMFRAGHGAGPVAFALPGGEIVLTDELVALASDDREIMAIAAHNLGLLQQRARLISSLSAGTLPLMAALDRQSAPASSADFRAAIIAARDDAKAKLAADAYAIEMLRANGIEPSWLATMLHRIEAVPPQGSALPGLLARESAIRERVSAILQEP